MFRFLLYMRGYYSILVSGYGAERFINLCKIKNIYLWDLQMKQHEYSMNISKTDYRELTTIIEKTGVKVDIQRKYGLPFLFIGKYNRILYIIFLVVAISLIFLSNIFVWKIEFEGNYTLSKEQLSDFLDDYNVKVGTLKKEIDYKVLEENLRKQYPFIKWCSIAVSGNTLVVKIEENSLYKQDNDSVPDFIYSDIIASSDGIITSLMVKNGLALVKIGDTVTKGQILVTGQIPIYDDSLNIKNYQYYDANADIKIETTFNNTETLDDIYYVKEYTGRVKNIPYFQVKGKDLRLMKKITFAYYDIYTTTHQFSLFGLLNLPLYYGTCEAREYYLKEEKYKEEEVVTIFNEKLSNYYETLDEKGVQILQKNVKIEHNVNKWVMSGEFVVSICDVEKQYRYSVENIVQ